MPRTESGMKWVAILFCMVALLALPQTGAAQNSATIVPGQFQFQTFDVPNQSDMGAMGINDFGTVVGYYQSGTASSAGPVQGFEFTNQDILQTLVEPFAITGDAPNSALTMALGVNNRGAIVGAYVDPAAGHYAGFFLSNGNYTSYKVPGYSDTGVEGINSSGDFCGWVWADPTPSSFVASGLVAYHGNVTVFSVPGAVGTAASAINDRGQVTGIYVDTNNVIHTFTRDPDGTWNYPIDAPGANTPNGGTFSHGINNFGALSGTFFDASNNEHGFLRTSDGRFFQIDVPGAVATAANGLNNSGVVVGAWVDQEGNSHGYIAIPGSNGANATNIATRPSAGRR